MKGTSKLIMGATLVMVVSLAVVLGLILVLLAELYCSLLLRRRKLRNTNTNSNTTIPTTQTTTTTTIPIASSPSHAPHPPQHSPPPPPPPPLSSIYAQGVLQAPRSFLFPCTVEDTMMSKEPNKNHHSELLHQVIHVQTHESNASASASPRGIGLGLVSLSSSSPLSSFMSRAPPRVSAGEIACPDKSSCGGGGGGGDHLVYISNPIYENEEEGRASSGANNNNTPFETPHTSPSRLETSGSSGEDDAEAEAYTPPLTPIKKLPAEACSVSLRDARSLLGTSGSDSHSVNGPSSSSSASPCTSPSW